MKFKGPQKEEMISAGIDIGTSTTKLVISRFTLMNMAGGAHVPRIEIIDKQVIHRSPIYRTPLLSPTTIDIKKIEDLVRKEYQEAGIEPKDIQTGAVIITGETATKSNAEVMLHQLSDQAGEFLVATAGPDLEGIIAAKGSGAYEYSKDTGKVIANIDIGGGTANVAVYKSGRLCGTCTLHVGGRLIEFKDNKIQNISPPVKNLLSQWDSWMVEGQNINPSAIKQVTDFMADVIARMLNKALTNEDLPLLLGHEPNWVEDIEAIMFSGGISECIYRHETGTVLTDGYDDIGLMLAASLKESSSLAGWNWVKPQETVRATVLGAGMQTTEISGATIEADHRKLPMKNLPVYQIRFEGDFKTEINQLSKRIEEALDLYDPQRDGQNFAVYFSELPYLRFREIDEFAESILNAMKQKPNQTQALVLVLDRDYAKVLGQTLKRKAPVQSIICIDQIKVENGDYLDIGQVLESDVVPVIIKTLTFQK
ncbi:ethanolamine ammonia-lyase reactivating factor EutA [Paenibacillus sp. BSR1-1]|uniref:ethanolamine ammonia-lyase reactivating factor EutA n=1 Tax=Paenibacillus sp. BSR1-1 TaxID=3020845 RepID=UPI0025B1322B|nr:ethanolamine ammonia-lyase reactivating factor EutA [Paenibacillus sp. BSR1-1]MDN3019514.1 ethanolamine ammonia-lyase reactivating factor EutA [Paenibacillus sp. BSR1-1]